MPIIRSVSGLRATLGDGLNPDLIVKYAVAFSQYLPEGPIIIGRDGRPSGSWIERIISGVLQSQNREVHLLGIVPTPTVQLATEKGVFVGGISITASHNPNEWNGLKFLNEDGVFLDAADNSKLWSFIDEDVKYLQNYTHKPIFNFANPIDFHINEILALPLINKIRDYNSNKRIKVVVDAVNASGSVIVPQLLEEIGFDVIKLFCDESGIFPHTPEPIPENLKLLGEAVVSNSADFGIAVDPDADRLVLINSKGQPIGEEKSLVLSALAILKNKSSFDLGSTPNITVNLSSSRMIDDIASEFGVKVNRSPVGEINVVKKMKEEDSFFGGEGSGGIILPNLHFGRDSLAGIYLIALLIATERKSFDEIVDAIKSYEIIKTKMPFGGNFEEIKNCVLNKIKAENINLDDGIRIDYSNSWVQIRKSNTEPIIRIISEAETKEEAEMLVNEIKCVIA